MAEPAPVEVRDLRRVWPRPGGGELIAVDGASFEVRAGEVFGLLGPNGAGTTTTLRVLATLTTPTSGSAALCGHDVVRAPLRARACLGYVSASSGLPPRLTCREVLVTFAGLQGLKRPREAAEEALDRFQVRPFADRFVEGLSTGMAQRLKIAAAAIHRPPVLILDEPTSGLDVVAAQDLLEEISRAREADTAVVFSTHIMQEAEAVCDRIAVLFEGQIRAVDTLAGLLARTGASDLKGAFLAIVRGG
jgi:sodium transport system ATP-binding protein